MQQQSLLEASHHRITRVGQEWLCMFYEPADSSRYSSAYLDNGSWEVMDGKEGSRITLTKFFGGALVSALPEVLITPYLCGSVQRSRIFAIQVLSGLG